MAIFLWNPESFQFNGKGESVAIHGMDRFSDLRVIILLVIIPKIFKFLTFSSGRYF